MTDKEKIKELQTKINAQGWEIEDLNLSLQTANELLEKEKAYTKKLLPANLKQHNEICALNYKLNFAKVVIKALLNNSDENCRQIAFDFLEGKKPKLPEELTMEWRELNENTAISGPAD